MKSTSYFTIKAYLPSGQIVKSLPVPVNDECAYIHLVTDLRLLGCLGYYITTQNGKRYISIKPFKYPLVSIRSVTVTTQIL